MSEIIVLESEDKVDMDLDQVVDNPQEPLYDIPLSKGREKLSIKQRLSLLSQELQELEAEVEAESDPQPFQLSHSYLTEVNSMAKYAEDMIRSQDLEIEGDLGIETNVTRSMWKSLVGVLPESENSTYIINSSLPEEICEIGDRQVSSLASLSARVSRLEDTLGV